MLYQKNCAATDPLGDISFMRKHRKAREFTLPIPMFDMVMITMLTIYAVAAGVKNTGKSADISLPESYLVQNTAEELPVRLKIKSLDDITLDGEKVKNFDELKQKLAKIDDKNREIYFYMSGSYPYQMFTDVQVMCQNAGFKKFSPMVTKRKD